MSRLFDRRCTVTVEKQRGQSLRFDAGRSDAGDGHLDAAFEVVKSLKEEPNTCELTIWNLNEKHRADLSELARDIADSVRKAEAALKAAEGEGAEADAAEFRNLLANVPGLLCRIEAGYREGVTTIWSGDLRTVDHVREGPEWITTISSGDGERAYSGTRVKMSSPRKGADIDTVFRTLARALGVDQGNLGSAVAALRRSPLARVIKEQGIVIYGPASRELSSLARSAGLEWSIQDGALQLLERGKARNGDVVVLRADTGMIGTPSVGTEGLLRVRSLIIPGIRVGGLIQLDARDVKGMYRVERATWSGDTSSDSWHIEMEATRY